MRDSLHSLRHHQRRCSCRRLGTCRVRVQAYGKEEMAVVLVADSQRRRREICSYVVADLSQELLELDV